MSDDIRRYLAEGEQAGSRDRRAEPRCAPQGTAGAQLARTAGESMSSWSIATISPATTCGG